MAFSIIYFLIFLAFGIWIVSLVLKSEILAILSALLMFPLSIYIFVNGMDIFDYSNLLVKMFAAVVFAIAVYTSSQATFSLIDKSYN